ncbi:protein ZINC INDUCED FACILITATOR-LIKE 1-like [Forsythia ovata]|uniref:Protein ZINC INDUCED FACILITATOR-LIKE 1-like n=1 Tax=Forsythia ovata TaxID=205694 RepID=A0ABD1P1W0_9LAMI
MSFDRDYHYHKEFSPLPEEKKYLNSNFLPKDYDAATREFYSSVAKRTRSKRKIYFGVAHRNSYSSGDVEKINRDHGLDETFAPNACRKGKKTVGQSQGNSSSCKNDRMDKQEHIEERLLIKKQKEYYEKCPGCKVDGEKETQQGFPIKQFLMLWIIVLSSVWCKDKGFSHCKKRRTLVSMLVL